VLQLRGGVRGHGAPSTSKPMSFKDAVRNNPSSAGPLPPMPSPYIVEKIEEVPSLEITEPEIKESPTFYEDCEVFCRFNGFWPPTTDLYKWIHLNWTKN
jgi:hypothetical protein